MKIKYLLPVLLACLLALIQIAWSNEIEHPEGVVAYCFDGDTIKLKDRRVVRLAGIDAPETAKKDQPAQYYGRQARQTLESLCRGKTVSLQFPGSEIKDRHGRLIANVILPDGESVNEMMVSAGAAFFYPHSNLDPEFMKGLAELQAEAIQERRGLWDYLLSLPLAKAHYVGNRKSMRFFPADNCPAGEKIRPRNRENFGTLMDAFLAGYAPARYCIFWPAEK